MQRFEAIVSGRVQGVGFRWATMTQAERLGLTGSAVNRPDGTVAVEAQGEDAALDALREWLQHGPPSAGVTGVAVAALAVVPGESSFGVG